MTIDAIRKRIVKEVEARGLTLKDVSLRMGRNHAYLQQFIERGVPHRLKEGDRASLSELLGIPEDELGAPKTSRVQPSANNNVRAVPEYQVHVSAGGGAMVAAENKRRDWPFPTDYIRDELGLFNAKLALLEVRGDSMEPTLSSGDRIMVNMSDSQVSQPGIFVIFDGDGTVIKRVERIPASDPVKIVLISDNPRHGRYEVHADNISVVGRVVWAARRM